MIARDDEDVKGSDIRLCGLIYLQADTEFAAAIVVFVQHSLGFCFNTYMRAPKTC